MKKHKVRERIRTQLVEDISALGGLPFYLFISFFVFVIGEKKLFFQLIISLIFSYIVVVTIRFLYPKDRPIKRDYKNFAEKIDAASFPSHHSMRIAILSTLFFFYYNLFYLNLIVAVSSLLVLFSRYYLKKHFLSDILGGFLFGIIEAVLIILIFLF